VKLTFLSRGWADYVYWQGRDRVTLKRINRLIGDVLRSPFQGIGKPEPLRHLGGDVWSRRINEQDRLVYVVTEDAIAIIQTRYHY
jgi:toxin YoeB